MTSTRPSGVLAPATPQTDGIPRLREGIVVMPDSEGQGRIVKDPATRRYFRFDPVEGFIVERVDGKHSLVDIQIALATEMGESFSLDEIQEFIDALIDRGLTDGGLKLPNNAPELGQRVVHALESEGFRLRPAEETPPGMDPAQRNMPEAHKFDEAAAHLRAGRFRSAVRCLEEIVSANPANSRARSLHQLLVSAGQKAYSQERALPAPEKKKNPMYYQIPLFDPDALFTRIEPYVRLLWTPGFVGAYALLVATAAYLAAAGRAQLFLDVAGLASLGGLSIWMGAIVVTTILHEFAHGLTCKHFGGKVPELGFLLIMFFLPALYVDVSDAWLFRKRSRRALVAIAGPMFDLGVASLAIVAWSSMPPSTLRTLILYVGSASAASFLLNMNPLLRLDGYYILSDLSGIPNLRRVATQTVFGRKSELTQQEPRARWFVLVYGVLSLAYIAFVLVFMGSIVTGASTQVAGLWGPLLIFAIVGFFLRRPLTRLAMAIARRLQSMSLRGAVTFAAFVSGFIVIALTPWSLKVAGPAELRSADRGALRAEVAGNLAALFVAQGDRVEEGQLVARLDPSDLQAQSSMTASEVERAQAKLFMLEQGPEREHVRQAQEAVRAARAEVAHLRARHERLTRLKNEGLVQADLHEQVAKELAVSEGALRAAIDEARLVKRGARPEEVTAARAEMQRLQAKAADIQRKLEACELRAPASGVVTTAGLEDQLGARINAGETVMEIADTSQLEAQIDVLEAEIGEVRPDQPVKLRLTAFPDRIYHGRVIEIAPIAETDDLGRAMFKVRCTIEDPQGTLKPGMTGAAKVIAGRRSLAQLVTRRVLRLIDVSLL